LRYGGIGREYLSEKTGVATTMDPLIYLFVEKKGHE
jgi:hypothetical protein